MGGKYSSSSSGLAWDWYYPQTRMRLNSSIRCSYDKTVQNECFSTCGKKNFKIIVQVSVMNYDKKPQGIHLKRAWVSPYRDEQSINRKQDGKLENADRP